MENLDNQLENPVEPMETRDQQLFSDADHERMSNACSYLISISKWMKFFFVLTLIGIVFMALMSIILLIAGPAFSDLDSMAMMKFPMRVTGLVYLVVSALYVPMAIYIKRIFTAAETAAFSNDNDAVVEYLKNNKSLCKFYGILTIVMLGFCLLVLPIIMVLTTIAGA